MSEVLGQPVTARSACVDESNIEGVSILFT